MLRRICARLEELERRHAKNNGGPHLVIDRPDLTDEQIEARNAEMARQGLRVRLRRPPSEDHRA